MVNYAIITAAGWKGAGETWVPPRGCPEYLLPLATCPEPILPIDDRTTVLSRLVAQLDGYKPIIVVGTEGYLYSSSIRRFPKKHLAVSADTALLGKTTSPWTKERLDYISTLGMVLSVPDPDNSCFHDGYCRAIDALPTDYEHVIMIQGDTLLTDGLVARILSMPFPCQLRLHPAHVVYLLDRMAVRHYRQLATEYRGTGRRNKVWTPEGLKLYGLHRWPETGEWLDIDYIDSYELVKKWLRQGG